MRRAFLALTLAGILDAGQNLTSTKSSAPEPEKFISSNGAITTLEGPTRASATAIKLTSGSGFAAPAIIRIEDEVVTCASMTGNTLFGCSRGQQGTAAVAHARGTRIYAVLMAWHYRQNSGSSRTTSVKDYGAKGDGQVATDCSISAGSSMLWCRAAHFNPQDVSKVIAVYDAGPTVSSFLQPLSTTIARFNDPQRVELKMAAVTAASPSPRVVWGHNDTSAIQSAVDQRAALGGGTVYFPDGFYLTRTVDLPCAAIGTFGGHICAKIYSNIALVGSSRNSVTLENWDVRVSALNTGGGNAGVGVITLGRYVDPSSAYSDGSSLSRILITKLTLHQVKNPTSNSVKGLSSYGARYVEVSDISLSSPSYEGIMPCGGDKCISWYIHDNFLTNVGFGGPGYANTTSALNLNSSYSIAYNNTITDSAQAFELGGHDVWVFHNKAEGPTTWLHYANSLALNVNSGTFWNMYVTENIFENWGGSQIVNVLGISRSWNVSRNVFRNILSGLFLGGGLESNAIPLPVPVPAPHGTSILSNNLFLYDDAKPSLPVSYTIVIGGSAANNQESWVITNNTIRHTTQVCSSSSPKNIRGRACKIRDDCEGGTCAIPNGVLAVKDGYGGGAKWVPSHTYAATEKLPALVRPNADNDYYYSTTSNCKSGASEPKWPTTIGAVVNDNICTWKAVGKRPIAIVSGLRVEGPANAKGFTHDVSFETGANRQSVIFDDVIADYELGVTLPNAAQFQDDAPALEIIPAGSLYSDTQRYSDVLPTGGRFSAGTHLTKITRDSSTSGWVVNRAGYAAPVWNARTSYSYGFFVVPARDNGHVYLQIVGGGCVSGDSEPVFITGPSNLVADNRCTWQEAGAAVWFHALSSELTKPASHPSRQNHNTEQLPDRRRPPAM